MKLSANEAAKRTGKSVPTITRAIKSGKISAEKTGSGGYLIDPSELFRVYKPLHDTPNVTPKELGDETPAKMHFLEEKIRLLETSLAELKSDRDEWREQAKRLALSAPDKSTRPTLIQRIFRSKQ